MPVHCSYPLFFPTPMEWFDHANRPVHSCSFDAYWLSSALKGCRFVIDLLPDRRTVQVSLFPVTPGASFQFPSPLSFPELAGQALNKFLADQYVTCRPVFSFSPAPVG